MFGDRTEYKTRLIYSVSVHLQDITSLHALTEDTFSIFSFQCLILFLNFQLLESYHYVRLSIFTLKVKVLVAALKKSFKKDEKPKGKNITNLKQF